MADEKQDTIAQILEQRQAAVTAIQQAYTQLNAAKIAIIAGQGDGGLTDDEKQKIATLDTGMGDLQQADIALALSTVASLNSSAAAEALKASLDKINGDLNAQMNDIKNVSATITEIGTVAQKIDSVIQTAGALAGLFV